MIIKISELGLVTTLQNADFLATVQDGVTSKITGNQVALGIKSIANLADVSYVDTAIANLIDGVDARVTTAVQSGIPFYFANQAAFPTASLSHGAIAHSHSDGKMYYAHGGVWIELSTASTNPADRLTNGEYEVVLGTDGSVTLPVGGDIKDSNGNSVLGGGGTWPVLNTTGSSGPQNVAIGENVHQTFTYTPGLGTVAIGAYAGQTNQGGLTVAVGWQAGQINQSNNAIAIGYAAGQTGQEDGAVAIGAFAGNQSQGADAIAIGKYAGYNGTGVVQPDNTIFLNATGAHMGGVPAQTNSFYVAPIRDATPTAKGMFYNTTTKEITTATLNTNVVTEGTNLYHTTARVRSAIGAGTNIEYNSSTGIVGVTATPTFTTVTTTNLNVQNVTFTGTGAVTISSGNDLNFVAAGDITFNGDTAITKSQLKYIVALSTDFAEFKALIAAL